MTIVTTYNPPPIPIRDFDWRAVDSETYDRNGWIYGKECPCGFGASEQEAITDLLELIKDARAALAEARGESS